MYRVFAVQVKGSTSIGGTCPNDFSDPIDQDIRTQCTLSWKIVVSEWRSVIVVSLNVGGGIHLIKPAKLYICTQTHYTHDEDGRTPPDVCSNGIVPLSHSRNVVTRIGLHTYLNCQMTVYLLLFPGKKAIGRTTIQWIVRIL